MVNKHKYQELLESLRRKSELLDQRQEELEASYAILRQIVRRLSTAEERAESTPPTLPRLEATLLLRYLQSSNPKISAASRDLDSSQKSDSSLPSTEQIKRLNDKLLDLEILHAKDWIQN